MRLFQTVESGRNAEHRHSPHDVNDGRNRGATLYQIVKVKISRIC